MTNADKTPDPISSNMLGLGLGGGALIIAFLSIISAKFVGSFLAPLALILAIVSYSKGGRTSSALGMALALVACFCIFIMPSGPSAVNQTDSVVSAPAVSGDADVTASSIAINRDFDRDSMHVHLADITLTSSFGPNYHKVEAKPNCSFMILRYSFLNQSKSPVPLGTMKLSVTTSDGTTYEPDHMATAYLDNADEKYKTYDLQPAQPNVPKDLLIAFQLPKVVFTSKPILKIILGDMPFLEQPLYAETADSKAMSTPVAPLTVPKQTIDDSATASPNNSSGSESEIPPKQNDRPGEAKLSEAGDMVVKHFINIAYSAEGSLQEAYGDFSARWCKGQSYEKFISSVTEDKWLVPDQPEKAYIGETVIDPSHCEVDIAMQYFTGKDFSLRVYLVKEEGSWKIDRADKISD